MYGSHSKVRLSQATKTAQFKAHDRAILIDCRNRSRRTALHPELHLRRIDLRTPNCRIQYLHRANCAIGNLGGMHRP